MEASVQALLAIIVIKSSRQKGTGLSKDRDRQPVRLMLYFDESHELLHDFTTEDNKGKPRSAYPILCRSLNSVQKQDVFVVYLSTNSSLQHYSPRMDNFKFSSVPWISAGPVPPEDLQALFVELPFDITKVKERDITLTQVSKVTHMAQFGRPLYVTLSFVKMSLLPTMT